MEEDGKNSGSQPVSHEQSKYSDSVSGVQRVLDARGQRGSWMPTS